MSNIFKPEIERELKLYQDVCQNGEKLAKKDSIDNLIHTFVANSMTINLSLGGLYTYCLYLTDAVDILKSYRGLSNTNDYPSYMYDALLIDMANKADFLQSKSRCQVISLVSAVEIIKKERERCLNSNQEEK